MQRPAAKRSPTSLPQDERRRRKREAVIILVIIVVIALLTYAENRIVHFGADFPVSNTILMFILININLLLAILLLFLVLRNLVKLLYERRRQVMGAKLRTRLVVAFIALTLLPTIVLFFFSINFITNSIEFWFNVPVEQALENSIRVGRNLYEITEERSQFYIDRISYQVKKRNLLETENGDALARYIQVVQRAFNLDAVEIYDANSKRITYAVAEELEDAPFRVVSAGALQHSAKPQKVRSFTQNQAGGELVRTIGTIPFGVEHTEAEAFVVATIQIPAELSANMGSISRGYEEYRQIKMLKEPIQVTYYITLSIVALLVVFCAVWFGFYLAKSITIPLMELAEGTRRVAEGDLGFSIKHVADDEIGSLVNSFNRMTEDLRTGREQLELSAQILRKQNVEIEERRKYMEIVLRNVSAGVITLDADGMVTTINKSAERMLNLVSDEILGKNFKALLRGQHLRLAEEIIETLSIARNDEVEVPLKLAVDGRPRSFLVNVIALREDAGQPMGIVMVFDDLTEMEKAQRMAAWREVARRIAHEVKNPLTPISLSAQRLKRKYSEVLNQDIFNECTATIIDHVELIRNLVNEFSAFARFPTANPKPEDLVPIIEETIALYREGHPNIAFEVQIVETIPQMSLDRQQIKQAMINLIENAIAAIKVEGHVVFTLSYDPILKLVRIEVADDGSGISDEDKTRLFEPNFSTKTSGMGLGLTIVSSIVADHNGMIRVQDNRPRGAKFVIELPV